MCYANDDPQIQTWASSSLASLRKPKDCPETRVDKGCVCNKYLHSVVGCTWYSLRDPGSRKVGRKVASSIY